MTRSVHRRLLVSAAALGACALPWAPRLSSAEEDLGSATSSARRSLQGLGTSALPAHYGLGVVALPAPPPFQAAAVAELHGCPVEVRAIVLAEPQARDLAAGGDVDESGERLAPEDGEGAAEGSFAILGLGADSWLLRAGEAVQTSRGVLAVSAITASSVALRLGDDAHRCRLASGVR